MNFVGQAWWVEISTDSPKCTYYFGPFLGAAEADSAKKGYVEDLEQEGAQQIRVVVKRCQAPSKLTVYDDDMDDGPDSRGNFPTPAFSGQP